MGKALAQDLEPEVPQEEIQAADQEIPPEPETLQEPRVEQPVDKATEVQNNLKAAMQEERKKRKEIEQKWNQEKVEAARKNAVLEDRLQQLWQAQQPHQQQPQIVDPARTDDPLSAMQHNQQVTWAAMQQLHQNQQHEAAVKRQEAQKAQFKQWAKGQADEFSKTTADYNHAYEHMLQYRAAELNAMGLNIDQIKDAIEQDEMWIAQSAVQTGKNPAELVYNMAKATGYKGPVAGTPSAEQKIDTLNKGMAASKDLGNGPPTGKPSAQQIADMSDDEFAELKSQMKKKGQRLSDVL